MTGRPWLSPGRPPWAPPPPRPPWWHGIGHRAAIVAMLIITDPARAYRAWREPLTTYRQDDP